MSWIVIFSLTILDIFNIPPFIWIESSSPTPLTRRFDKLSISSVNPSPLTRFFTYSIVCKTSSFVSTISSSGTLILSLLLILYLPTSAKSYLCGLKNICFTSDLALSTVTKSPGLNFLNTSITASSFVVVLSFNIAFAIILSSGLTSQISSFWSFSSNIFSMTTPSINSLDSTINSPVSSSITSSLTKLPSSFERKTSSNSFPL